MTGTPHSDVTALSGMSVPLVGRQHIRLHAPATAAPMNIERGRSTRWFDVRETKRAIWGTASPRKATGPHNDVGTADSTPVMTNTARRTCLTEMPRLDA